MSSQVFSLIFVLFSYTQTINFLAWHCWLFSKLKIWMIWKKSAKRGIITSTKIFTVKSLEDLFCKTKVHFFGVLSKESKCHQIESINNYYFNAITIIIVNVQFANNNYVQIILYINYILYLFQLLYTVQQSFVGKFIVKVIFIHKLSWSHVWPSKNYSFWGDSM